MENLMDLGAGTLDILSHLYPDFKIRLIRVYNDMKNLHGLTLRVTEGMRSYERTKSLWEQGRSVPGHIVTHEPPGHSMHCFGVAADSCFVGSDPFLDVNPCKDFLWSEFGRLSAAHGLEWGGSWTSFQDKPHVQIRYGLIMNNEIQFLYQYGGLRAVWTKFDQIRGVPIGSEWKLPT